jgi:hypothetical protein
VAFTAAKVFLNMLWQVTKASVQRDGQPGSVNSDSARRVAVLTHMGRPAAIAAATRLVEGITASSQRCPPVTYLRLTTGLPMP